MTPHGYTEDQLVEQPAIGLFADLGWQTVSALEESFGAGGTLGERGAGPASSFISYVSFISFVLLYLS